jgi:hypothetical protein
MSGVLGGAPRRAEQEEGNVDGQQDLGAAARNIIDTNLYMVLGTADSAGQPWVSPVFYSARDYTEFYWISSPDVTHSTNLAVRPDLSIAIFDSRQPAGTGLGVYMSAVAEQLDVTDVDRALEIYPGPAERGARTITSEELRPPGPYRIYRAVASQHYMLCPRETGKPCEAHGRFGDHRVEVNPRVT